MAEELNSLEATRLGTLFLILQKLPSSAKNDFIQSKSGMMGAWTNIKQGSQLHAASKNMKLIMKKCLPL